MATTETNLPPPSPGVFNASATVLIDAPIDDVWRILLDFESYGEWNPFVRRQILTDAQQKPLPDQIPAQGKHLFMGPVHIPPSMAANQPRAATSFEIITALDHTAHRVAWRFILCPNTFINSCLGWVLKAERWQALSTDESGWTKYETREVFGGPVAWIVKWLMRKGLQEGFEAMGNALKERAERK